MTEIDAETPRATPFQKVAECLYRHTPSGNYYALVKRAGKQIRRSLKTKDRKIAERKLSDFRRKVTRLSDTTAAGKILFSEIASRWLETLRAHLKPSSFTRRETSVTNLNSVMGSTTLRNVTAGVCQEWARVRGNGLAASTYNNELETLWLVLDYARREGMLLDNPADELPRRKLPKSPPLVPSKEQFALFVQTLRDRDARRTEAALLVELLAYSGARLREATGMRWRDVNFATKLFTVTGGERGTKNHEARVVPLFPALEALLERLRASRNPEPASDDFVITIASAKRSMEHACKKANLPDFTHHTLRHYFVSNAIEAGVDFKTIAAWVGHKDGGLLVAKTYGHLRDAHSHEMAKRMTFSAG